MASTAFDTLISQCQLSIEGCHLLMQRDLGRGEMWIVMHGITNAFYSLSDLFLKLDDPNDPLVIKIRREIADSSLKQELSNRLTGSRNRLTHQGIGEVKTSLVWMIDNWHDTVFPERRMQVSVGGSEPEDFRSWIDEAKEHLEFLCGKIQAARNNYSDLSGQASDPPDYTIKNIFR